MGTISGTKLPIHSLINLLKPFSSTTSQLPNDSSGNGMILSTNTHDFLHGCWLVDAGANTHVTFSLKFF